MLKRFNNSFWTSFCSGNLSVSKHLLCNFCSSDRGFASNFFQTPPHDGCPCLWLTVPTAKPLADFHRLMITHAEHTTTKQPPGYSDGRFSYFSAFSFVDLTQILSSNISTVSISSIRSSILFPALPSSISDSTIFEHSSFAIV